MWGEAGVVVSFNKPNTSGRFEMERGVSLPTSIGSTGLTDAWRPGFGMAIKADVDLSKGGKREGDQGDYELSGKKVEHVSRRLPRVRGEEDHLKRSDGRL